MCYAIPARILEITGENARVDYGGVIKTVNISLVEDPRPTDLVLIHAGLAIEKLDRKAGEETLQIIKNDMERARNNGTLR